VTRLGRVAGGWARTDAAFRVPDRRRRIRRPVSCRRRRGVQRGHRLAGRGARCWLPETSLWQCLEVKDTFAGSGVIQHTCLSAWNPSTGRWFF